MHIVIVAIDEVDAFVTSQVVERLLHRQSKSLSELRDENQRPFYFIGIAIHNIMVLPRKSSKIPTNRKESQFIYIFLNVSHQYRYISDAINNHYGKTINQPLACGRIDSQRTGYITSNCRGLLPRSSRKSRNLLQSP